MSLTETTVPARAVSAGVDWAKDDYAVCVVDADGEPLQRVTLRYTKAGLRRLVDLLDRHGVDAVGIERPDGPIVDALLAAGRTVFVVPTLATVSTSGTRLERHFDPAPVHQLKATASSDLTVGGANLAAQAFQAGLVDEYQLFVWPTLVGGGKPALPTDTRADLE